ncbi:hypothetical protein BC938DRAFT_477885, partial [Jimgerdemannia flammicorona]
KKKKKNLLRHQRRQYRCVGVVFSDRSNLKAESTASSLTVATPIIPAHAWMFFLARSFRSFQLEELKPRIKACFRGTRNSPWRKFQATVQRQVLEKGDILPVELCRIVENE